MKCLKCGGILTLKVYSDFGVGEDDDGFTYIWSESREVTTECSECGKEATEEQHRQILNAYYDK